MSVILRVKNLKASYGPIHALKGVDIDINEGEIVTLIGSNGAGKSTTLMSIMGMIKPESGSVVEYRGKSIINEEPTKIVKSGICLVPEGREVFPKLSVKDNLRLGAYTRQDKSEIEENYSVVYDLFPILKKRDKQIAGTLSGGEQQMLAIGRALMAKPKLLMFDEPSLGLAPTIVQEIFALIKKINTQGTTILLVEQNAYQSLLIADRGYIMETGLIKLSGSASDLRNNDEVRKAYLGSVD